MQTHRYLIIESATGRTLTGASTPATAEALLTYWTRKTHRAYHCKPING
jgi:hypothetical protein